MLNIETTTVKTDKITFHGIPVEGNVHTVRHVSECNTFLVCAWNGSVEKVLTTSLNKIPLSYMEPIDKGNPGLFAVDKAGSVIASIVHYPKTGEDNEVIIFRGAITNTTNTI